MFCTTYRREGRILTQTMEVEKNIRENTIVAGAVVVVI